MPTLTIIWTEPRVGDGWSIWQTECGTYRIDFADGVYTPRRLTTRKTPQGVERFYEYIGRDQPTLADAMDAINLYHCTTHKLILV